MSNAADPSKCLLIRFSPVFRRWLYVWMPNNRVHLLSSVSSPYTIPVYITPFSYTTLSTSLHYSIPGQDQTRTRPGQEKQEKARRRKSRRARLSASFTSFRGSASATATYLMVKLLQRRLSSSSACPMTSFISFQSSRPSSSSFVLRGSFLPACFIASLLSSASARSRRCMP